MKLWIPKLTGHWGDFLPSHWAAEYIKETLGDDVKIYADVSSPEGPLTEWLEFPWLTDTEEISNPDMILATHHRHTWAVRYPIHVPLLYFDIHGMFLRMVHDNWYPSFLPTKNLEEAYKALNLPEVYDCLHLSGGANLCNGLYPNSFRLNEPVPDFIEKHQELLSSDVPLYATDNLPSPDFLTIPNLPAMVKIYMLNKARKVITTPTGFTSIAGMYRRRDNVQLVNYRIPETINLGPVPVGYSNITFNMDPDPLAYAAENKTLPIDWKNYYTGYVLTAPRGLLYETLQATNLPKPPAGYKQPKLSLTIENALVPLSTTFTFTDTGETFPLADERLSAIFK